MSNFYAIGALSRSEQTSIGDGLQVPSVPNAESMPRE